MNKILESESRRHILDNSNIPEFLDLDNIQPQQEEKDISEYINEILVDDINLSLTTNELTSWENFDKALNDFNTNMYISNLIDDSIDNIF